jgi:uncharacterized protein YdaU (DUF1376 family)
MSEAPYMQLYVGDYLGDTRHLTTEQHGAYLLLLMAMWSSEGELPNDESKLARMAGVGIAKWRKIGPDVMEFFTVEGAFISQKRLKKEREKWELKSAARREAGKRGGDAKALKEKEPHVANAIPIATILPQQNPSIYHIPDSREEKKDEAIASSKEKAKATRLSKTWVPSFDPHEFGSELNLTTADVTDQMARFRDYWASKPGAAGTKLDWDATLRNWLREAAGRKSRSPPRNGNGETGWQRQIRAFKELDDEISQSTGAERTVLSFPKPGTY